MNLIVSISVEIVNRLLFKKHNNILCFESFDVFCHVVTVDFHSGSLRGQLVNLPPQFTHLLLVQVSYARSAFPPQMFQLPGQYLILLLEEAHFIDVIGEAVVQVLHLRLLIRAIGLELGVDGVGQGKIQIFRC